jgi:hypothetical protein
MPDLNQLLFVYNIYCVFTLQLNVVWKNVTIFSFVLQMVPIEATAGFQKAIYLAPQF